MEVDLKGSFGDIVWGSCGSIRKHVSPKVVRDFMFHEGPCGNGKLDPLPHTQFPEVEPGS